MFRSRPEQAAADATAAARRGAARFRTAHEPCTRPVDTRRRREGSLAEQPVAAEIRNSNAAEKRARMSSARVVARD